MNKSIFAMALMAGTILSGAARANVTFNSSGVATYVPTLTHTAGAPINSGYGITFTQLPSSAGADFVYYLNNLTPIYYQFTVTDNPSRTGGLITARQVNTMANGYVQGVAGMFFRGAVTLTSATIGEIYSDFYSNYSDGTSANGGAIYNDIPSSIAALNGDFIRNYALASTTTAFGGAIGNAGLISTINGSFIGNYASGVAAGGGGIYNIAATITNINGDFVGNYAQATGTSSTAWGGAILNGSSSTIGTINGNFIGNSTLITGDYASAYGGAIYNSSAINKIDGNFIGNSAQATGLYGTVYGGAIYNTGGTIGTIDGSFIRNSAYGGANNYAAGGAIYSSSGTITAINGDFIGNYAQPGNGGAIFNNASTITAINGSFINNHAQNGYGGAIYNNGGATITNIEGDFINNYAWSAGAIWNANNSTIGAINGNFTGNYSTNSYGGAIWNDAGANITSITGNFTNNHAVVQGGAIYNTNGTIGDIEGDFIGNYVSSSSNASGGAIYNFNGTINSISGNFVNNYASGSSSVTGGAIYNYGNTISTSGDFIGNYARSDNNYAWGGAIYNTYGGTITITGGNFIGNYALTTATFISDIVNNPYSYVGRGGAIYTIGNLDFDLSAAGDSVLFMNNYTASNVGTSSEVTLLNSLYLDDFHGTPVVNLNLASGTDVNIMDPIVSYGTAAVVNQNGSGDFLLWGDNSGYLGALNINDSSTFYLMFDETSSWAQRHSASLDMASAIAFAGGTTYRPMVSNAQLASLNTTALTVDGSVAFLPFNVSALDVGLHTYGIDYSAFGVDNVDYALFTLDTVANPGETVFYIKHGLTGYEGLSAAADAYRQRDDLTFVERQEVDDIFYTGIVTPEFLALFGEEGAVTGADYTSFAQINRDGVRRFNRTLSSRLHNKDSNTITDNHLWLNVGQNWVRQDTKSGVLGYNYDPVGITLGYDNELIANKWYVGLAMTYATGEAKSKGNIVYSKNDVDEYIAALYTKYQLRRFYATASTGGGVIKNDTTFRSSIINTRGKYDTNVLFANGEVGYDVGNYCIGLKVEPYVGAEYAYLRSGSYNERGEGARHFDSQDWSVFETPVGLRVSQDFKRDGWIITPQADAAYAHNWGDRGASTLANFVNNPVDRWTVSGHSASRDSYRGNLNLKFNHDTQPFAFNLGYGIDYRSDYRDQQIYATIRYDF